MVVGEWVAGKLRASSPIPRLTKKWLEQHVLANWAQGGTGARGLGRGGTRDIATRVFQDGAGFPRTENLRPPEGLSATAKFGVAELAKKEATDRLRELVETNGECDRIVTDCFALYPTQPIQDDTLLSKPNAAYDWLHFHDALSSRVYSGQEWELTPYLSQSVVAFHQLFASSSGSRHGAYEQHRPNDDEDEEPTPFTGPRADFDAFEAEKNNRAILLGLQSSLNPTLLRIFRSPEDISIDLLPQLMSMLTPDVKPVVVGGSGSGSGDNNRGVATVRKESERSMVRNAVRVMAALGVTFEKARVEAGTNYGGCVYRMEP